jgi:protocatechuate 3,4-dioxygenase beta subunit
MNIRTVFFFTVLLQVSLESCSQSAASLHEPGRPAGGDCEACGAVFEFGNKQLTWTDTLPDFHEPGPKLELHGTIYQPDGKTPAPDVILYVYHTDQHGEYSKKGNETGWGKTHGYIRGWIKTGKDGRYRFYTLKPGAYPGGGNPAHIHPVIKEPGVQPYWIDEFLFEGDPYITETERQRLPQRGGPGIRKAVKGKDDILIVERDIILGLNVPGY